MATLFVDKIDPQSGTSLEIGSSGDTITIPSGATITNSGTATGFGGANTPAFYAHLSSSQSVSNNTDTKAQINSELFDTDNCYDNSTNYRFTPTVAGHYFVTGCIAGESGTNDCISNVAYIYKNGSAYTNHSFNSDATFRRYTGMTTAVVYMNGSSDYIELFGLVNSSGTSVEFNSGTKQTFFTAYKIIE